MFFIWWSGKEEVGCCLVTTYNSTLMQYRVNPSSTRAILNYLWVEIRKIHDNVKRMTEIFRTLNILLKFMAVTVGHERKKIEQTSKLFILFSLLCKASETRIDSRPPTNPKYWNWIPLISGFGFRAYNNIHFSHISSMPSPTSISIHGTKLALWSFNSRKIGILPIKWNSWDGNFENDYHAMVCSVFTVHSV